jgi:hypothetical protein
MNATMLPLSVADMRYRALQDTSIPSVAHTALSTSGAPAAHMIAATREGPSAKLQFPGGAAVSPDSPRSP